MTFIKNFKKLLKDNDWSAREFSKLSKIKRETVQGWFIGRKPNQENREKLEAFLDNETVAKLFNSSTPKKTDMKEKELVAKFRLLSPDAQEIFLMTLDAAVKKSGKF